MPNKTEKSSGTLYDYLFWRGDITFDEMPPNEVDALIFAMLGYIDFENAVPPDFQGEKTPVLLTATKKYLRAQDSKTAKSIGLIIPKEVNTLLVKAAKTARFGLTKPFCYINRVSDEEESQFCAVSYLFPNGDVFVCYRGTDDTLVGWKESLKMSFMHPIPAQIEAERYLETVADITNGKIYLGGHSKGGNLAIYASVKTRDDIKERIVGVYNYDGPGFNAEFVASEEYQEMGEKIMTIVPQSSVIGMLLEHTEPRVVVKSTLTGPYQHNGLSWCVTGGKLVHLEDTDEESQNIDRSLKEWLYSQTPEERALFLDSFFEALGSTNAKTLTDLNTDKLKLLRAWGSMSPEARTYLMGCFNTLMGKKPKPAKEAELKSADLEINSNETEQQQI